MQGNTRELNSQVEQYSPPPCSILYQGITRNRGAMMDKDNNTRTHILIWLTLFALAMAYVEAALVVHLRHLYYAHDPLALFPLQLLSHSDLAIESGRELATIVMLITIALLSERNPGRRFAVFVYVFAIWDLGYYAWLKLFIDWPQAWREWDVLFLIPWPWFGPWLTPALIAVLFACWGAWVLLSSCQPRFNRFSISLFVGGGLLVLAAFLLPAAVLLPQGEQAFQGYKPDSFDWVLFVPGYIAMVSGLFYAALRK